MIQCREKRIQLNMLIEIITWIVDFYTVGPWLSGPRLLGLKIQLSGFWGK